ncbi:MAG: polyketide synthase dehydratase domain-containing protein, partial [Phaeodactylibacter sp.]|nr:polyketide synthase dehydratase domain-containing protein [Phaeodactylibacter sp.]
MLLRKAPAEPAGKKAPASATAGQDAIQGTITGLFARHLKLDASIIEADVDFSEYGVDSILMMKLLNKLEDKLKVVLEPTALVNYPSVEQLAAYLAREHSITLEASSDVSVPRVEPASVPFQARRQKRVRFEAVTGQHQSGKIAIIGMSCRLPQSDNLAAFWENLRSGRDLTTEAPPERWDAALYYSENNAPDKTYTNKGGFISHPGLFDARYFKVKEEDAITMDPQQRLVLEMSRDLFAHAGYQKEELNGSNTGVYIGAKDNNYTRDNYHLIPESAYQHTIVNSVGNMIAARVSDFYDLHGASQVIDTACSSALVAVHEACEAILAGKMDMAVAGGVYIMADPFAHISFSQAGVLSRDGKSYVFDERAQGFVLGEGGALVLLKEYEAARRAGDQIFGVILGSAVNNDGRTMGLTVPNQEGQKAVIEQALQKAKVSPEAISYYEAHGTGTLLGDPIEVRAATEVYAKYTSRKQYCAIGSVKSNLGHTMTAAGITGLVKILLQMQHGQLAPTLHCEQPHPRFRFEESPFYPITELKKWDAEKKMAAISSFGFGGTNCHLILEEGRAGEVQRHPLPISYASPKHYWLCRPVAVHSTIPEKEMAVSAEEVYHFEEPYLQEHRVNGEAVVLGVTYCSLAVDALKKGREAIQLSELLFQGPVVLQAGQEAAVHIEREGNRFSVKSRKTGAQAIEVAKGKVSGLPGERPSSLSGKIQSIRDGAEQILDKAAVYSREEGGAVIHGPGLQVVEQVYVKGRETVAELSFSAQILNRHHYTYAHPALLNGALLAGMAAVQGLDGAYLPLMLKSVRVYAPVGTNCVSYAQVVKTNREIIELNYSLCNQDGDRLVDVEGFICKRFQVETTGRSGQEAPEPQTVMEQGPVTAAAEAFIREQLRKVYKGEVDEVSGHRNFMDLGVDSSQLIALVKQLEQELGLELYPTLFFEYQNIASLSAYLAETYPEKFAAKHTAVALSEPSAATQQPGSAMPLKVGSPSSISINPLPFTSKMLRPPAEKDKEPIAIIGMHGIFPGARDTKGFWRQLYTQADLIREIPADHFDFRPWYGSDPKAEDKMYCKWGSFIDDVDKFDAPFFNISPREAEMMDPQLRYLLQVIYGTAEDAACIREIKGSNTGLFVGVCFHDYAQELIGQARKTNPYEGTGNAATMLANRPSFYFDLRGPSMAIDTACSSSLFALHTACKALQNGECEQAFAAGVNLLLSSRHYRYFCSIGALSATGRCHTFDSRADGYVPGEAVAAVLLKPLSKAEADGDRIYGIIRGGAVGHGGYTPSITAPSVDGEMGILLKAWEDAGVTPDTLGYIEAHGTGTKLGDPVEVNALKKAYQKYTGETNLSAIGSAKAHIGHTEGAAGIIGVIKALLSIRHQAMPAMPMFEQLNPYMELENSPFYINREPIAWPRKDGLPLRAGVSSFGFGGAYAHIVIEEYQPKEQAPFVSEEPAIVLLSAKNEERLKEQAENLRAFLQSHPGLNLYDVAYTLQTGRDAMEERLAIVAKDKEGLQAKLGEYLAGNTERLLRGSINKEEIGAPRREKSDEALLKEAMAAGEAETLAQLWVEGVSIDWNLLYPGQRPQKISLPTYPFARKRYWYDSYPKAMESKEPGKKSSSGREAFWSTIARGLEEHQHQIGGELKVQMLEGGIALVQMNSRQSRNMFTPELILSLQKTFVALRERPELKAVVLTGYDNVFCMGGSEEQLQAIAAKQSKFTDAPFLYRGLLEFDVPVISAIQGHALGGGLLFGLYADIVILSEKSTYSANFMKYGFTPGMGATYILGEKLGKPLANEMMYTARLFSGEELKRRGASVRITENVLKEALQAARELSEKPRRALEVLKQKISEDILAELYEHIAREEEMHTLTFQGEEVQGRIRGHFDRPSAEASAKAGLTEEAARPTEEGIRLQAPDA